MSKTCQNIFDRAIGYSSANVSGQWTGKTAEILDRINYSQQRLFTRLAQENRYFFVEAASAPSNNAAADRQVDLDSLDPPAERVLAVKLPTDVDVNQVDLQDVEAELAPRFYPLGSKIIEVGADWGASGVVTLSLWYAYRPDELDLAGNLTQTVTVPDRFCEYLELDLAMYFAKADFGRRQSDPAEIDSLQGDQDKVFADFLTFLDHFPGVSARRFILPTPTTQEKA